MLVRKMTRPVRARISCSEVVRLLLVVLARVASDFGGGGSGMNVAGRICIDEPSRDSVVEERTVFGDVTRRTEIEMSVMAADSIRRKEDRSGIVNLNDCFA